MRALVFDPEIRGTYPVPDQMLEAWIRAMDLKKGDKSEGLVAVITDIRQPHEVRHRAARELGKFADPRGRKALAAYWRTSCQDKLYMPFLHELQSNFDLEKAMAKLPILKQNLRPGACNGLEGDIVAAFAGVRPILDVHAESPSEASREEDVWEEHGLLSVAGGKLTTWRVTAQEAVDEVLERLPHERTRRVSPCHTHGTPLVGLAPPDLALRIARASPAPSPPSR